jgi:hypothetical protein
VPGSAIAERLIRSGEWAGRPAAAGYRCGLVGDILVERVIWDESTAPARPGAGMAAAPGQIWFRFWLLREQQIVEKYFDAAGRHLGTQVDVCMPLVLEEESWFTHDLLLDIFIAPDGQVTVRNEAAFEAAVAAGTLSPEEQERAEQHVRVLTAAIAQGRFPPALVRNFQPDMARIRQEQAA